MSLMVGVISYMPSNKELHRRRIEAAHKQLKWLHSLYPTDMIYVVSQNYDAEDFILRDFITYISYEQGIGAARARNRILELFYTSDYDFLLLCDDDTVAYPYYQYEDFMRDIRDNPAKFQGIDAVSAVEPEYHGFKESNYKDVAVRNFYKFTPREINSGSATSFIRNIVKYYHSEPLYFSDIDANKQEGREDINFLCSWLASGYTWYQMNTWIRKSLCFNHSSIFGTDIKSRDTKLQVCLQAERVRFNIPLNKSGTINWSEYNRKYNRSKKVLYIPRIRKIDLTDKEIPKQYKKKGLI